MIKRIALSSLNGINGTVFVYGQTGSGKTYSMLGRERKETIPVAPPDAPPARRKTPSDLSLANFETANAATAMDLELKYLSGRAQGGEQPGVLVFAVQDLFGEIAEDREKTYFLRCSYVEIYNEQVFDLLRTEEALLQEPLHLNEDKNKDFYVRGATEEPVSSLEEVLYYLRRGELNRHYAETRLNRSSSRSHTLFRLQVQSITNSFLSEGKLAADTVGSASKLGKELKKYVTQSVLNFVDLAGSEKVAAHFDRDPDELFVAEFCEQPRLDAGVRSRVREGKNINKSLFFLTQVIQMRARAPDAAGAAHVPYRNSPLTKILRSSLGGNSRTCIVVCVTPSRSQWEQTLSSLRFGQNAMKIENKVHANIIANNNDEAVRILIADYERKIKSLEKAKKDQQRQRELEARVVEQLVEDKRRLLERLTNHNLKHLAQVTQLHVLGQAQGPELDGVVVAGVGVVEWRRPGARRQREELKHEQINWEMIRVQREKIQLQQEQIDALVEYVNSFREKYD